MYVLQTRDANGEPWESWGDYRTFDEALMEADKLGEGQGMTGARWRVLVNGRMVAQGAFA